jgi:site-specific DNA-methyltransferase (adenine-specific)
MADKIVIGDAELWHGDWRDVLPLECDAVVTDPPYGTGAWKRDSEGMGSDCRASLVKEDWDRWDASWMDEVGDVTIGLFLPRPDLIPFLRLFVWVKPDPRPRFAGQPAYGFEPFVVARGVVQPVGGMDYVIESAPRLNRDKEATGHPHQKPEGVMCWAVGLCAGEGATVLDPYMGSGTTGVACIRTGRKFIGIEKDDRYFAIACNRIETAQRQGAMLLPAPAAPPEQAGLCFEP